MFLSDFWNRNPLLHDNFLKLQQKPFVADAAKFACNVLVGYRYLKQNLNIPFFYFCSSGISPK